MSRSQDSFRKLLDVLTETSAGATSSGSIASVAQPLLSTQRRTKTTETLNPSIYSAKEQKSSKAVDEEHDASRKAPVAPTVTDYGLWKNSALIGKEQRQKKSKKITSEAQSRKLQRLEEASKRDEPESELDRPHVQRALKNMSDRHKDEKWSTEELSDLGKRLVAAAKKPKLDELECGAGQRSLNLAETRGPDESDPKEQGWRAGFKQVKNPYKPGTPEHEQWADGKADREAQPDHYNESVEQGVAEGFFGGVRDAFYDYLIKRAKEKIPAEHHKDYDFDSMRSIDGTNNLVAKAKAAGHLKKKRVSEGTEVDEVITKNTPAGEIIHDFEHSKDKRFKGKTKAQRKNQALGAYYGMHPEKSNKK